MSLRHLLAAAALCVAPLAVPTAAAHAQGAAEHVAMGDRERFTNPASALKHYEAALATAPADYDALTRASIAAVDLGESTGDAGRRSQLYKQGEQLARRAVQAKPADAEGHFALARALGRTAQSLGSKDRVKYAGDVRQHALEALKYDPKHAGALHIMGMWNAEVMRLSGLSRFAAKTFLGGKVFDSASWNEAQRYLEQAVQVEPGKLTHRIDLAGVYADRGNKAKAEEQIDVILKAPGAEANDRLYKQRAEELRQKLR